MTGYYVVRRSMDLQEEFGPTEIEGISFISGISRIDEVGYSWVGIGNEGKGSWSKSDIKTADEYICEIYAQGQNSPVIIKGRLKDVNSNLYTSYDEAERNMTR